jgi:hypothetical protein
MSDEPNAGTGLVMNAREAGLRIQTFNDLPIRKGIHILRFLYPEAVNLRPLEQKPRSFGKIFICGRIGRSTNTD